MKKVLDSEGLGLMSVAKAVNDLEALRAEIAEAETRLAELQQRAIKIAHYIEMASEYTPSAGTSHKISESERRSRQPGDPPKNVRESISILRNYGHPMKTKDLIDELAKRGIPTGGQNPVTNLSSALSRFKNLLAADRSEGWSLREWFSDTLDEDGDIVETSEEDRGGVATQEPHLRRVV